MKPSITDQRKKTNLFVILSAIFLTNAIIAEIIGVKIFSLENTMGFEPAQINLMGSFLQYKHLIHFTNIILIVKTRLDLV